MPNEYDALLRQEDNADTSVSGSAAPLPAPQVSTPAPVRQTSTRRNEYDDLVELNVLRERSVMFNAAAKPADAFARAFELSKKTGLPTDVVWRNFDQVDKHAKLMELQRASSLSPEMRKLLSDASVAPMAVDDLSTLESIVTGFKRGVARLEQTKATLSTDIKVDQSKKLSEVNRQLSAGIAPEDIDPKADPYNFRWLSPEMRTALELRLNESIPRNAMSIIESQKRLDELKLDKNVRAALESKTMDEFLDAFMKGPVEFIAAVGAESLPASAPGLAAAVVGGPVLGAAGVAAAMGGNSFAVEYASTIISELQERGVDLKSEEAITKALGDTEVMDAIRFKAQKRAAAVASFDALSGGLATRTLVGNRIANVVLQSGAQGVLGAAGEVAGGFAEGLSLDEMTFGEIAAEFFGEFVTAPVDVAAASFAARADRRAAQAANHEAQLRRLQDLSAKAVESKLRERAPESFAQLVQDAAEANGEPDAVYVDPYALNEALQQSNIDPGTIAGLTEQLEDALALNADVRIEVGEFAAKLSGTEAEAALLQHIKLDPEGLSAAEAQQQTAETLAEFDKEVESILREEGSDQASRAEGEAVKARVLQQLTEANRFTNEVNAMYASLTASFYRATAARMGMSPEQLYERFPLRVAAERIDAPQLTQLDTTEENFRAWFGNSKAVDEDGAPMVMYHGTTATTIDEFDPGRRKMIFVTDKPETANLYADDLTPDNEDGTPDTTPYRPVIYPVFVRAENPFEFWNEDHIAQMEAYLDSIGAIGSFYSNHARRGSWEALESPDVQEAIKALGFDSFYTAEHGSRNLAVYNPSQVKSIFNEGTFAIDDPRILKQGPSSDIGHKREKKTGRYVGAPDWIGASPAKLAQLRKKLRQLAQEGEPGRFWYENSSKAILDMVGGDRVEAEKIVSLIAIYSPNATVPANTMMALTAYYQFKAGLPIKAGLGMNNRKAADLLERGEVWSGIKTNSFYQNLMVEIDPSKLDEGVATMDMWMALAFDYGMKALDQGPKYKFAERETQRLAAELGWTAHQVQAAIWTAIKGRIDPIRPALKKAELKNGIGEMVEKNGKMVYRVKPDRRYDHFRLAHKMGMASDLKREDIIASKYDFSDALRGAQAQLSWEATPSKTKGDLPGIHIAPTEQRLEYLQAVMAALTDENGHDMIAQLSGVPQGSTVTGWSAWEGDVGAGAQTFTPVPAQEGLTLGEDKRKKRRVKPMARELMNLHAAIMGYVLGQDAVVWHQPIYDDTKADHNGVDLEFARPLNEEEFAQLYKVIIDEFGMNELAPAYTPHGARVLNFVEGLSNKQFQAGMQKVVDSLSSDDFGGGITDVKAYRSDGSYIFNDWKENPNGEGYQDQIGRARRPDLQQRAADLRARVEAVNRDFERRYGWDRPDEAGSRRDRVVPEGELSAELPQHGKPIEGSREVTGYHYSKGERTYLHSVYYGQGLAGEEAARLESADPRLKHRIYFYLDRGEGITPEGGVGSFTHATRLRNLYDVDEDTARLKRDSAGANEFEVAIIEAGFDGYFTRQFNKSGVAVLLGERSVQTKYLGHLGVIPQTENVVPPAAPRQLDLFEQIASDKRLPVGQLSGKRWLEILTKLSPDLVQQVSKSPVFQLDQPMYKDVLARRLKNESDDAFAQSAYQRDTIEVDGVERPALNSNGQLIHPTEEGLRNFWRWFGDSKVVDEQGRPLVVYHGTPNGDFTAFSVEKAQSEGGAFFFSHSWMHNNKAANANTYATVEGGATRDGAVLPVYLKIDDLHEVGFTDRYPSDGTDREQDLWFRGVDAENARIDRNKEKYFRNAIRAAKGFQQDGVVFRNVLDDRLDDPSLRARLRAVETDVFAVFSPEQIKSATGNSGAFDPENPSIVRQGTGDRGSFVPSQNLIVLLNDADLSTFLHELGHFFLHVTGELAMDPDAPAEMVRDMQTFLSWAGVEAGVGQTRFERWSKMSLSEQRDAHEKFARGFEAYLFEDRAPSVEMRNLFRRFAAWLRAVYRQLTALRVELTDEVRGVMDRMIASEDEIKIARTTRGLFAMFTDAEIGTLTSAEWEEYQELARAQTEEAVEQLQTRSVREMKWLSNARAKVLRDLQKQAAAARKQVEAEQRAEMEREPIRAAETFLRHGEAWVNGEKITTDIHGLSIADLDEMYDRSVEEAPDYRSLGTGRYGMLRKDGMHPDVVAKMFGFGSGDQLVRELVALRPIKDELADRTDAAMLEQHGELQDMKSMEEAAMASLANEARARMVAIEARALERAQRVTAGRTQGRRGSSVNLLIRAARDHAKALIGRKKIRDIRPSDHTTAEAKAARQAQSASKAGDIAAAAAHKRNQLVHHYASKEATKARESVQKGLDYLRKFTREGTRKNIDRTQLDQIDQLLERYELKAVPQRELDKRASLAEWVASQEAQGLPVSIDPDIIERASRVNYTRVTLDEFDGLVETVKNIEHLGRLKKKLLTAKDQRELQAILDEMAGSIVEHARSAKKSNEPAVNLWERTKKTTREYLAMHRKIAMLGRMFDGNKDGGVFWERFIRPMNEAGDAEASMRAQATQDLMAIFQPMLEGGRMNVRELVPGTEISLTREERLVIALNWGNETNRQRVLDGEKWTQNDVEAILGTLTDEDWTFVQQVWDYLDSWYPKVNEKQRRVFGTDMGRVEGIEFRSPTGKQMRGGYYPIKYDPNRSRRAEAHTVEDLAKDMMRGAWTVQTTRRGHTKARVDKVQRPMLRDLGVIFGHTQQVIHDLAWHEWLIDATRILRDGSPVAAAIRDHYGAETLKAFEDALTDIAAGEAPARNTFEQVLNHLRTGATVAGLGWNLMTALLQPYGLTQSMVRIGPGWVAKGLATWMGDAARFENTLAWIRQRSKFMENRMLTMQREISEIRNRVRGQSATQQFIESSFFALIARTQLIADIPTWLGMYEKAMANGNDEARAAALADQAVIDAQGGGQTKDLAAIQRGSPALKLFTNFYSFFSTTYNLAVNQARATNFRSPTDVMRLAIDYLLLFTIPSVLTELMRSALLGDLDDKDGEDVAVLAAQAQISYLLGTLVGPRELGSAVQGFYGYSGPAGLRFFGETAKLVKQASQGEADAAFFKALNNTAGILLHYPSGQVQRTVTGVNALIEGETQNPMAILTGPPRD